MGEESRRRYAEPASGRRKDENLGESQTTQLYARLLLTRVPCSHILSCKTKVVKGRLKGSSNWRQREEKIRKKGGVGFNYSGNSLIGWEYRFTGQPRAVELSC